MNIIAAADKNWAIGNKGELLAHLSGDMRFFRSKTVGNVVILGRKTLASFPGGKPLKDRVNIVLTSNENYTCQDALIVHSIDELLEYIKKYNSKDVYVIGGESVYSQLLQYCDTAYITKFDKAFEQTDVHIDDLDNLEDWFLEYESEHMEEKGIKYCFCTYRKK